jgi:hypothetical protein
MKGPPGEGHELFQTPVGVAEDPGQIWVVGFLAATQGHLGRQKPFLRIQEGHQTLGRAVG